MAIDNLHEYSDEQIETMMKQLLAEHRTRQQRAAQRQALQFKVGDRVQFDGKTRGLIKGTLVAFMAKNVKVKADDGVTWKVWPGFLQPAS